MPIACEAGRTRTKGAGGGGDEEEEEEEEVEDVKGRERGKTWGVSGRESGM